MAPRGEKRVEEAFKKLPKILTHIGKITFYRERKSHVRGNPADVDTIKKEITLYDSIYQNNFERVITHELSHILYDQLSDEEKDAYIKVAGWRPAKDKTGKEVMINTRTVFTEPDGSTNPNEDFSNNLEYYLFDKKTLETKNPKIYQWIKKYMENKEK